MTLQSSSKNAVSNRIGTKSWTAGNCCDRWLFSHRRVLNPLLFAATVTAGIYIDVTF
jgi:hypothetical protein